ncbi:arylsulfotransferase family protein, partial [Patulibacter sp. S7RM1-6]
ALVALASALAATPAGATTVSPQPDSRVASPATQLSFRGATVRQVERITVTGSRSGRHDGTVRAHSDGRGASWVPKRRFLSNERVTVRSGLDVVGADRGGTYRIRTARFVSIPTAKDTRRGARDEQRSFATRPDLRPPALRTYTPPAATAPGALLLGPKFGAGQAGPMILDRNGKLRWFDPQPGINMAGDVRVQTYRGAPVLTYWEGKTSGGEGHGTGVVLDERYRRVARVRGGNGYTLDIHEFALTPRGTALVTIYQPVRWDLRPVGGSARASAVDSVVQEIDVATGLVVFEWHSLDHVPLSETVRERATPNTTRYDYFHVNSIDEDAAGDLLISARQTSALYKLRRATGAIAWRLGGERSDFRLGRGAAFALQHDARLQADGNVRVFDNSSAARGGRTRSLTLHLDEAAKTATVVRDVRHPGRKGLFAATQGNSQVLGDGAVLFGWGSQGRITEVGPDGRVRYDAELPPGYDTYRAYRQEWHGRPTSAPRAVATRSGDRTDVRVSWNGAMDVAAWRVLATDGDGRTALAGQAPWRDFETRIPIAGAPARVTVQALDAQGAVIGTSRPVSARRD